MGTGSVARGSVGVCGFVVYDCKNIIVGRFCIHSFGNEIYSDS